MNDPTPLKVKLRKNSLTVTMKYCQHYLMLVLTSLPTILVLRGVDVAA
jgi:hypothetical protein